MIVMVMPRRKRMRTSRRRCSSLMLMAMIEKIDHRTQKLGMGKEQHKTHGEAKPVILTPEIG